MSVFVCVCPNKPLCVCAECGSHSVMLQVQFMYLSVRFSSVAQSCLTLCTPMDCSTPGFPVHHQLPELAQTHVHWVSDAIQASHPLLPASALNLSQHQGLFQWVDSLHQVTTVLEFPLQRQFFQWIFRVDFCSDWLVWSPGNPRDSQESSKFHFFILIVYEKNGSEAGEVHAFTSEAE